MTISEMLGQSGILTLLGLGVVFSFLIILIGSMKLLHLIVHVMKLDQEKGSESASSSAAPVSAAAAPAVDQGAIVAAIATALKDKE